MPNTEIQKAFNEIDNKADAIRKEKELREKEEREAFLKIQEKVNKCEFLKRVNAMYHPGYCTNPLRYGNEDGGYRYCLVDSCPLFK